MNRNLLFIHWHDEESRELAAPLVKAGWTVRYGLPAKLSEVRAKPPAAVVISLRRLPSHGREVADAVWSTKWGCEIPIIFFDGEMGKVKSLIEQFPGATFVKHEDLPITLSSLK